MTRRLMLRASFPFCSDDQFFHPDILLIHLIIAVT